MSLSNTLNEKVVPLVMKFVNLKAVQAYENVFNYFKNNNVVDGHKDIIKSMFEFDASMLFNETLIYYNHVYNYVLSKMNDEEKLLITKYAIMSEKKSDNY